MEIGKDQIPFPMDTERRLHVEHTQEVQKMPMTSSERLMHILIYVLSNLRPLFRRLSVEENTKKIALKRLSIKHNKPYRHIKVE